jgi:diguanylate cyclase (GGDEF)-like protein
MEGYDSPGPSPGTAKRSTGRFAGDPLRDVRILKRWVRLVVYSLVAVLLLLDHFIAGTAWLNTIATTAGGGGIIATVGIEFSFFYFAKLRKQGIYPAMLAVELGATDDFGQACERSVRLVAELLGAEKVILAWSVRPDQELATMATHGIPPDEVPLATLLPWCQRAVKQAMEKRRVVVTPASEGRSWLSSSDSRGRVVYLPLLSLDRFVGLLVVVGGRKAADLRDKTLLSTIGLAIGLTLDNLHHSTELHQMATRDELTKLFNRRDFFANLEKELRAAWRSRRPLGLLILDVDNLKLINDTYGHNVGDAVLANLGKLLARRVRADDMPARIGGDEFAVLMPDTDKRRASAVAARLEKALQRKPIYEAEGLELRLSVSCGVAGYPWSGEDVAEIVQAADADMYAVKATRKAGYKLPPRPGARGVSGQQVRGTGSARG